jgi:hypothetical protein
MSNVITVVGKELALLMLTGAVGTAFDAANSYIAVGTSSTAANNGQTALVTEFERKAVDGGYPTAPSTQMVSWVVTFNPGEATCTIKEWGLFNAAVDGVMFSRLAFTPGIVKGAGETIVITYNLTVA